MEEASGRPCGSRQRDGVPTTLPSKAEEASGAGDASALAQVAGQPSCVVGGVMREYQVQGLRYPPTRSPLSPNSPTRNSPPQDPPTLNPLTLSPSHPNP